MRHSTAFLLFLLVTLSLVLLTAVDATYRQDKAKDVLHERGQVVAQFGLSDLALSTEARYSRNLSLSDRHSAFQDHPVAFDYFPAGSLFLPPGHLKHD